MAPGGSWRRLGVLGLAIILSAYPLSRARAEDSAAKELVRNFVGHCLQTRVDADRIKATAQALGWRELDRNMATMLAPQDKSVPWKGWFVREGNAVFFIGVSQGEFRGRQTATCTIANGAVPISEALTELDRVLPLGRTIGDYTELGQRSRAWAVRLEDKPAFIMATDAVSMGVAGFSLAVAFPQ